MMKKQAVRLAAGAVGVALMAAPASAQGFFDQLFGTAPSQPASPTYNTPNPFLPDAGQPPAGTPLPRRIHKPRVLVEEKPVKQQPTDLMHDKTLRVGDAVMMRDGIHIYTGPHAPTHTHRQFVALDDTHLVARDERERLAALDVTRSDPLQEGRAATTVVDGYKITDAHGRSVRYVGP